jgi:hypothetical protein
MLTVFASMILHTQLLVATPGRRDASLLWNDAEVSQGFAWNPEIVGFGVPDHDGTCLIGVETEREAPFAVAEDALWAVSVPFTAREPVVEVGTVLVELSFPIRPGRYQLVFQARPGSAEHAYRLDVIFVHGGAEGFAILRQGELESGEVLSRRARRG